MGKAVRKRASKTSKGINKGAKRNPQTKLALVSLGKGQFATMNSVSGVPWRGIETVQKPFDADQVEKNKILYPHLFTN